MIVAMEKGNSNLCVAELSHLPCDLLEYASPGLAATFHLSRGWRLAEVMVIHKAKTYLMIDAAKCMAFIQ